jgi:excisionase family DNA binding protein
MALVTASAEIRPGSIRERDLALIERALARTVTSVQRSSRLVDADGDPVEVPGEIVAVLMTIVHHLRAGNGISVMPLHAELTTVEAAELLNVSRPHLIKLLESGEMPFRKVGSHRRVRLVDVLAYRDRQDAQSRHALDELTRQAEALGLYD